MVRDLRMVDDLVRDRVPGQLWCLDLRPTASAQTHRAADQRAGGTNDHQQHDRPFTPFSARVHLAG